jgi:hypothetical protein
VGDALEQWATLVRFVNDAQTVGDPGVRDPENPCSVYDGDGYNGDGNCVSDGHYECVNCSRLSPDAPRFQEYGAAGRLDRIRLLMTHRTRGLRNG